MDANRGRGTDGRPSGALAARGRPQGAAAGRLAELEARRYLERQGLGFMAANYRCRYGELDLVMRDGACLAFVEVRSRGSIRSGAPEASLTARKLRRLRLAAGCFMRDHRHFGGMMLRFDVVGILTRGPQARIRWIRNAVQFDGR